MLKIFQNDRKMGWLVIALGFALLVNSFAMQVSGIVSVSGILSEDSVNSILIVLFIDYALIVVIGSFTSVIIDKFNRVSLIQWVIIIFGLVFITLRLMFSFGAPNWLNYSLMYIISEQQFVVFPLVFWVLANDIFNIAQAKVLFPVISGWNFAGKLLGIGVAAISPFVFSYFNLKAEDILWVNVFAYGLALVVAYFGLRKVEIRRVVRREETLRETLSEGWDFVANVAAFKYLMMSLVALTIADTIIEFRFLVVTDLQFVTQASYQTFFSIYKLGTTLIALLLQAFVTAYLIQEMKLQNTFYIFPIVALVGSIGMILLPGVGMAIGGMAAVKLIRDTIHDTGRASFLGYVPEERRGRVSTLIETYFPSFGTMLGCLLAGAVVFTGIRLSMDLHIVYMAIAAISGGYAIWAIWKMTGVYSSSLLNWRLKRRQRKTNTSLFDRLTD